MMTIPTATSEWPSQNFRIEIHLDLRQSPFSESCASYVAALVEGSTGYLVK